MTARTASPRLFSPEMAAPVVRATLATTFAVLATLATPACRAEGQGATSPAQAEGDDAPPQDLDAAEMAAICSEACGRLSDCAPRIAMTAPPGEELPPLAGCRKACRPFADPVAARRLHRCLQLQDCGAFHACAATGKGEPQWHRILTATASTPRDCDSLCARAATCANEGSAPNEDAPHLGELHDLCLEHCESPPEDSVERIELVDCVDHRTCEGLLACLDGWAGTTYDSNADPSTDPSTDPTPGFDRTCHRYCTRAIRCAAEDEELDPAELDALQDSMTDTYVECAIQCEKQRSGLPAATGERSGPFEACIAKESCEDFSTCADDL